MFPDAPVVRKSTDYAQFKKIEWNRSVDKGNLDKLLVENKKKFQLHRFPILVSRDFRIIDGQHRFEAAKKLGAPIYFIMDGTDTSFKAVHSVNKAGKRHTLKDRLEMLHKAGDENATKVFKVYEHYKRAFELTTVAAILSDGTTMKTTAAIDKEESIVLRNYKRGLEVLDALSVAAVPNKTKKRTVMALAALSNLNKVAPKAILKRVQKYPSKWIEPTNKQECERAMATCYNYCMSEEKRIRTSARH